LEIIGRQPQPLTFLRDSTQKRNHGSSRASEFEIRKKKISALQKNQTLQVTSPGETSM